MATLQLDFFRETDAAPATPQYYIGTCTRCHTTQRREQAGYARCKKSTCSATVTMHPIKAQYHAGTRCDARCMSAQGPECLCSCAGRNHGRLG
jgi:hypothetical protein